MKPQSLKYLSIAAVIIIIVVASVMIGVRILDTHTQTGSGWIVTQLTWEGNPFRCWELRGVPVVEKNDFTVWSQSTGQFWVGGARNKIRVSGDNWDAAYKSLGLSKERCQEIRETLSW